MGDMDTRLLIPSTVHIAILEFIIIVAMVERNLGFKRPATLPLAIVEFILLVMIVEVDPGLKIPATLPLIISDK